MAFDAFLKIEGIDGEGTTKGYEKWINLIAFNWGALAPAGQTGAGGGATVGRPTPEAFSFTKLTDTASPTLFAKMCTGVHFQKVTLNCVTGGPSEGALTPFIKIDFSNVLFSSYTEGGNSGTDQRPMESVSFAYASVEMQVTEILPDGQIGQTVSGGFNFGKGKRLLDTEN